MTPERNNIASIRRQHPNISSASNQVSTLKNQSSFRRVAWIRIAANKIIVANSDHVWLLKDKSKLRFT